MKKIIIFIFVILCSLNFTYAQWTQTNGPQGAQITRIESNEGILAAGTVFGNIYFSTDNGNNWINKSNGLPGGSISSIIFEGDTLYTSAYGKGIYKSINRGQSWSAVNNGITNLSVNAVFQHNNYLFAGTQSGLFISTNSGVNWIASNNGFLNPYIECFASIGNKVFAGTMGTGAIYMSIDEGASWVSIGGAANKLVVRNNTLFGAAGNYFYSTTDFGNTWQSFIIPLSDANEASFDLNNTTIFVCESQGLAYDGVYASTDNGVSWNHVFSEPLDQQIIDIKTVNDSVYLASPHGIYKSTNNGANWQLSYNGMKEAGITSLLVNNNRLFAGSNLMSLNYTTDNGNSWLHSDSGFAYNHNLAIVNTLYSYHNFIFSNSRGFLYRSPDNGNSWQQASGFPSSVDLINTVTSSGSKMYAGSRGDGDNGGYGVWISTDDGLSWVNNNPGFFRTGYKSVLSLAVNDSVILAGTAGTYSGGVFRSVDNGVNWVNASNGMTVTFVYALITNNNVVFAGTNNGLYKSTNYGNAWTNAGSGITDTAIYSFLAYNNYLFAAARNGIYLTTNNGDNWIPIIDSWPTATSSRGLAIYNDYLFSGTTSESVWKHPLWQILPADSVSGEVMYSDNNQPVNSGHVRALMYDSSVNAIIVVDSAQIQTGGSYILHHVPQDSVYIMAYPNDEFDFVPTYYPSTIDWKQAVRIDPNSNMNNINISVFRINNSPHPYTVSGKVFRNTNNTSPISDAIIYAKSGNTFINFGISGYTGFYSLNNLNSGSYVLTACRIGYNDVTRNVDIVSSNRDSVNFYMTGHLIGINNQNNIIPKAFALYNNYPNPFNPSTVIRYDIPKASLTKLVIYDVLGRVVTVLVNEELKAGSYTKQWNASNYASGIYFYRIESGDFAATKKMVLIK